jgi:hypothetical protein
MRVITWLISFVLCAALLSYWGMPGDLALAATGATLLCIFGPDMVASTRGQKGNY